MEQQPVLVKRNTRKRKVKRVIDACSYVQCLHPNTKRAFSIEHGKFVLAFSAKLQGLPPDVVGLIFSFFIRDAGKDCEKVIPRITRADLAKVKDRYFNKKMEKIESAIVRKKEEIATIAEDIERLERNEDNSCNRTTDSTNSVDPIDSIKNDILNLRDDLRVAKDEIKLCQHEIKLRGKELGLNFLQTKKNLLEERGDDVSGAISFLFELEASISSARSALLRKESSLKWKIIYIEDDLSAKEKAIAQLIIAKREEKRKEKTKDKKLELRRKRKEKNKKGKNPYNLTSFIPTDENNWPAL